MRLADAVLDAYLNADPEARTAVECLATTNFLCIAGETRGPKSITPEVIETVAEAAPEPEPAAPAPVVPEPEQPTVRTCPNCGAVVSPTAHFCIVCGTKLD